MSETPEKETFISVIVACVTRNNFNGKRAADELAQMHNYPIAAAAFATLLALIYLDSSLAVDCYLQQTDKATSHEGPIDILALLDNASVAGVINAWSRAPEETYTDNPTTMLMKFAMGYRAFRSIGVLLAEQRIIDNISVGFLRKLTGAMASELTLMKEQQTGTTAVLHVPEQTLTTLIDQLEDGFQRTMRSALHLISEYRERTVHIKLTDEARAAVPETQRARLKAQIQRDRCAQVSEGLQRTKNESEQCLARVTNDALDLLVRVSLAQKRAKTKAAQLAAARPADPDTDWDDKLFMAIPEIKEKDEDEAFIAYTPAAEEFDALKLYNDFELDVNAYGTNKLQVTNPPDTAAAIQSHITVVNQLRQHIAIIDYAYNTTNQKLQTLQAAADVAQDQAHNEELSALTQTIATINPDTYLE